MGENVVLKYTGFVQMMWMQLFRLDTAELKKWPDIRPISEDYGGK
jgi:hypothetical protein